MRVFENLAELASCVGQEVSVSEWHTVSQEQINGFAHATGDHQWIHIDPERAKSGPFGATIAHGFLTLSLLPMLAQACILVKSVRMGVNYGLNKVRFMAPVPAGSKVRARFALVQLDSIAPQGAQLVWNVTFEVDGATKPACVAESVARQFE